MTKVVEINLSTNLLNKGILPTSISNTRHMEDTWKITHYCRFSASRWVNVSHHCHTVLSDDLGLIDSSEDAKYKSIEYAYISMKKQLHGEERCGGGWKEPRNHKQNCVNS